MRRWFFNIAAAKSMLLMLATVVLWVRSGSYNEGITHREGHCAEWFSHQDGSCEFGLLTWHNLDRGCDWVDHNWEYESNTGLNYEFLRSRAEANHRVLGVEYIRTDHNFFTAEVYRVQYWLIALLAAVLPVLWIWTDARRRRRIARGQCGNCGYDMRGSEGACPECGTGAA